MNKLFNGLAILAIFAMGPVAVFADEPVATSPVVDDPRSLAVPNPDVDPDFDDDGGLQAHLDAYERELRKVADTHGPPVGAKQISKLPDLFVDRAAKRVFIDGYVTLRRGQLEMFACPIGSKEHESVIALFAKSSEVHTALLAIGAKPGSPVAYEPEFQPPTGQSIAIWAAWRDDKGKFQVADARQWLQNTATNEHLDRWWVFAGSKFWTDPSDGIEYYTADGGDMICVSNFSTAMLDVPFDSSAQTANLLFQPFTDRVPVERTPVRLVLQPLPEGWKEGDALQTPDESVLPKPSIPADE